MNVGVLVLLTKLVIQGLAHSSEELVNVLNHACPRQALAMEEHARGAQGAHLGRFLRWQCCHWTLSRNTGPAASNTC